MKDLVFRANGDYRCGYCMANILFDDTYVMKECQECGKAFSIPREAAFMYEGFAMKDGVVRDVEELSLADKMHYSMVCKAMQARGDAIMVVNLDKLRAINGCVVDM